MEGKYTEWPNPQISGENRQSGYKMALINWLIHLIAR